MSGTAVRYLLDTNVVSALRVPSRNPAVAAWAGAVPIGDQFIAALTISEIELGVATKERSDAAQGAALRGWFENHVLPAFSGRILPFDLAAARVLAGFRVPEHAPLYSAIIGATASVAGMTVVTRNLRHFEPLGIACLNPWDK